MAKKKKAGAPEYEDSKSRHSTFQWILFVIVIPLLFALTITLIVMTFAGVNIFEKAKDVGEKIPGISNLIDDKDKKADGKSDEQKVVELQGEIENKKAEISQLQKKLEASDQEIEKLLTEKDRLEIEMEQLQKQEEAPEGEEKNENSGVIKTYESMSPKNIANILINLSDNEAVGILTEMSTDKQGEILEKLPPEIAAKYTKLLSNQTS